MGVAIEVAQATVTIIPNMKGAQSKIAKDLGAAGDSAGKTGGLSLGKSMLGTLGKVAAAAGIGKMIADSISQGAALQQSLGGIETLFKENADVVKGYASEAYKTAGISANDYMENVTSFSAALIKSMDGDTAAAAEMANTAMIDMADNANKMGTDMSSIQTAYQGFAKQNYTMLDNLKLGYGGTKEEMQRLLADASELSGVEYDISNLGDVYEAIHVIQEDLDITGTTAKEAATTFSGSFASMKAAAQDLMGNLALGNDIAPQLDALADSVQTFLIGNLLPMASNVIQQIPQVVAALPGYLAEMIPQAIPVIGEMVSGLSQGIIDNIPVFLGGVGDLLNATWDSLTGFDWSGAGAVAVDLMGAAWDGLKEVASGIWDFVVGVFTGEVEFPDLSGAAREVWNGLSDIAGEVWGAVVGFFESEVTWPNICDGAELIWNGLTSAAESIWNSVVDFFTQEISWPDIAAGAETIWNSLKDVAEGIWNAVVDFFTQDIEWADITKTAENVWNGLEGIASGIWDAVVGFFTQEIDFPSMDEVAQVTWGTLETVASGVWAVIQGIFSATDISFADLSNLAQTAWDALKGIATGVWDFIKGIFGAADISFADLGEVASDVWNGLEGVASTAWELVKGVFGAVDVVFSDLGGVASTAWSTLKDTAGTAWGKVKAAFAKADVVFADLSNLASEAWNNLKSTATGVWDGIKEIFGSFDIEWPDFGELAKGALDGLKSAAQSVWDWVKGLFGGGKEDTDAIKTVSGTTDEMAAAFADVKMKVGEVDLSNIIAANEFVKKSVTAWKDFMSHISLKVPHVKTSELVTAKNSVSSAANTYKSIMNFSWQLPALHGSLPIISVSMRTASSSDGKTTVSYPELNYAGTKWFAKGGIFNDPTIIGIGDSKGPEAAVPLDMMWERMSKEFDKHLNGGAQVTNYFTVDGAQDPEAWATDAARAMKRELRMA